MFLDVTTLVFINAFIAAVSGTLLVLAWSAYRDMKPVLWWAAASLLQGLAHALLPLSAMLAVDALRPVGLVGVVGSAALLWHAARLIEGYGKGAPLVLTGPLLVLATVLLLPSDPLLATRLALLSIASYLAGTAWIVGRSGQRLGSRWPLTLLIGLHALTLGTAGLLVEPAGSAGLPDAVVLVLAENLVFLIGTTIFVVAGLRERSEIEQRRLAMQDALTGLHNRGSFFALAEAAAADCRRHARPLSVSILDLDHFKRVNDTFGHAIGDHVLLVFADCARKYPMPGSILGRIGGEEFALLLPGADGDSAQTLLEDLRRGFQAAATLVGGHPVDATLSAGVAFSPAGDMSVTDLMRQADGALYAAKAGGRNRVVVAGSGPPERQAQVVRVA